MKHISLKLISSAIIASSFSLSSQAADIANGEKLHQESCIRCHDTGVYTREVKRVKNLQGLGKQVRFCRDNQGLTWFDDEVEDVVDYLNQNYYHF